LPGGGSLRDQAIRVLRDHITDAYGGPPVVYGMDFPFTLPRTMLGDRTWEQFVLSFKDRFSSPEQFRTWCRQADKGRERKRHTEEDARVPFAAYNLRLYRQTYYGIRDVIRPLVVDKKVWVPPIQQPNLDRPWLMETCPASALKRLDLYSSYKGDSTIHCEQRSRILSTLLDRGDLYLADASLENVLLEDPGGDALDSLIAAMIAFWNAPHPIPEDMNDPREGYVYR
jgi:hypothetical protein